MDLKPFKLDIDELINEFAECGSTTLAEFKRVWLSRKFSFIFEARPSCKQGFFMQSLYAHCIGYMVSADSCSKRFGGLYCMYCLYETQPYKPSFKIYLSLGELKQLKSLAIDAKAMGMKVVSVLLKSMLEKKVFLFGCVGINEGSAMERIDKLTHIQNATVQAAYEKLFADSRLEHFIHMDMGMELEVDSIKKSSSEYAAAKELAIEGAGRVIDVEDIKHIAQNRKLIGEIVEKKAADWNLQKQVLYERTGLNPVPPNQEENEYTGQKSSSKNKKRKGPCDNHEDDEDFEDEGEYDNFGQELEDALLQEPFESDDEEDDSTDT